MRATPARTLPTLARRTAFTLVELLAVIAVIGVLAAILIPVVSSMRQSARAAACASNMREISKGIMIFVADNKGLLPGGGQKANPSPSDPNRTSSVAWQEVLNQTVFANKTLSTSGQTVQRMGATPAAGQLYCPSIEPFGTDKVRNDATRAYVINSNTYDSVNTPEGPDWGLLLKYKKGFPIARFVAPARTVLLLDSAFDSDAIGPAAPLNQIVMNDGTTLPTWSANTRGAFAFRHKDRMNVVFMDGHLESLGTTEAAKINNSAHFSQNGL